MKYIQDKDWQNKVKQPPAYEKVRQANAIQCMSLETLYDALQVLPSADDCEIRKAYLRAAVYAHPDKGGDPEMFQKVQLAYEILGNP
jgi:DnaJ-class molecular chaperone